MSESLKALKKAMYGMAFESMSDNLGTLDRNNPMSREVAIGYLVSIIDTLSKWYGKNVSYDILQGMADELARELVGAKVVKSAGDPQP